MMVEVTTEEVYAFMLQSLGELKSIPPKFKKEFIARSEVIQVRKKEVLLEAAELSTHVYFIVSGLMMCYVTGDEDKIVKWVKGVNDYVYSMDIYLAEYDYDPRLTGDTIVALEDTVAVKISHDDINWLRDNCDEIRIALFNHTLNNTEVNTCVMENADYPPAERYSRLQRLVRFNLNRVPAIYLARLLFITLEELKEVQDNL